MIPPLSESGSWITRVVAGGFIQTIVQVCCLFIPFLLVALALRGIERVVQRCLARRFGWRSILWTAWLGTPIHELSHAVLCVVFRHRIYELSLFKPDLEAGRLGYVSHGCVIKGRLQKLWSYDIGNLFIGLAPLAGGTIVLYALLWVFYPDAARQPFEAKGISESIADGRVGDGLIMFVDLSRDVVLHVLAPAHLASWQLWVFLYLSLCVGGHMAPSSSDLRGSTRGAVLLAGVLLAANLVYLAAGGESDSLLSAAAGVVGPALAVFVLSATVCGVSAVCVIGCTKLLDCLFER